MHIYLTEGFIGEPARVTVNGTRVLDLDEATTNWSVGVAASAEAGVSGPATVVVELPRRRLRSEHRTEAGADRALLIAVTEEGIRITEAPEPVRFM